jgi:hypothetical protein
MRQPEQMARTGWKEELLNPAIRSRDGESTADGRPRGLPAVDHVANGALLGPGVRRRRSRVSGLDHTRGRAGYFFGRSGAECRSARALAKLVIRIPRGEEVFSRTDRPHDRLISARLPAAMMTPHRGSLRPETRTRAPGIVLRGTP